MKVLVTAFGPFGGRAQNASSLALKELKAGFPWIHSRLLPVDSVVAPARMRRALRELRPDAVLMLGEAAGSQALRLERMAWNQLDFTIPDAAGHQPRAIRIHPEAPETLCSTLPLESIHARLEGAGHAVAFSDDPGRYLCNQLMFLTLQHLGKHAGHCLAGFIHLPLEDAYPTPRVVNALGLVIRALEMDWRKQGTD